MKIRTKTTLALLSLPFILILITGQETAKEVVPRSHFQTRIVPAYDRKFQAPVFMTPVPGGTATNRSAILEKGGRLIFTEETPSRKSTYRTVLDIRKKTLTAGWEEGALGLAFDPAFLANGRFYLYYSQSGPRRTLLSRFTVKDYNPGIKLEEAEFSIVEEELLSIFQPWANHNGGMLAFGQDGMLYIGVGDGGSGGDPRGYAQNLNSHLGKILRIDVSVKKGYRIPDDNPFAQNEKSGSCPNILCKEEIFAWGLRNPWRFSIAPNGKLMVGDVGQNLYEELTLVDKGENHGWNKMEGFSCYRKFPKCKKSAYSRPILVYDHNEGSSILGGFIYEGSRLPFLRGKYIFGDSMAGKIWSFEPGQKPDKKLLHQAPFLISSFGSDHTGEILIADLNGGMIYRLEPVSGQLKD